VGLLIKKRRDCQRVSEMQEEEREGRGVGNGGPQFSCTDCDFMN